MNSVFYWVPWKSVKELLVITLSATIFTAPVILYYFGSISFLSPIVNLLLVPLLAYLSILGYPIIVMTALPFIGDSISLLTDYCLRYILSLVTYLAILAESAVFVVNLSFWLLLVWLGILIKVFLILNKRFH
jgi:competence protein ComEC